jgi:hypothetical protein
MTRTLSIIACPKPFIGHIALIQRNAIESWTKLEPRPRITLFGNEPGTAELCKELGLEHVPEIERNDHNTPLLRDIIGRGQAAAGNGLVCFVNADIVLMSDFMRAVDSVAGIKRAFLMIGQRSDLDLTDRIDFGRPDWEGRLRREVVDRGVLHDLCGIDYFVFPPGIFDPIPRFAVGRAGYDNWLVFETRRRWLRVIDATPSITAVHQNHDYSHHPNGQQGAYYGDEAKANLDLAGGPAHLFWIDDRTHLLTPEGLKTDLSMAQLRRHWDRLPVTAPAGFRPAVKVLHRLGLLAGMLLRAVGLRRPLPERPTAKQA